MRPRRTLVGAEPGADLEVDLEKRYGTERLDYTLANFDKRVAFCGGRIVFDSVKGVGSTPNNANVRYMGFGVLMAPKVFLRLTPSLEDRPRTRSLGYLPTVAQDPGWGPSTLYVDRDSMTVTGHEGRHRAMAFAELCAEPMLVHIFPRHERARNMTANRVFEIRAGLNSQREPLGEDYVKGPLFDYAFVDDKILAW